MPGIDDQSAARFSLDFVVIGARKSGTTWMYEQFSRHQDLCLSRRVKESHFFTRYGDRGLDWYRALFPACGSDARYGEVDPEIISCPESAAKVKEVSRDTKIIAVIRNPAEQFISNYLHHLRKGDISGNPLSIWRNKPSFRREVEYHDLLQPFFAAFPPAQIRVLLFDDLRNDPLSFINDVYDFIGVARIDADALIQASNRKRVSRFPLFGKYGYRLARWARKYDLHTLVNALKNMGIERFITRQVETGIDSAARSVLEKEIMEYCTPGIKKLGVLMGEDLQQRWSEKRQPQTDGSVVA